MQLFACILWSVWKQHNNKVWNDIVDALCFVLERATSMLFEWNAARKVQVRPTIDGSVGSQTEY